MLKWSEIVFVVVSGSRGAGRGVRKVELVATKTKTMTLLQRGFSEPFIERIMLFACLKLGI